MLSKSLRITARKSILGFCRGAGTVVAVNGVSTGIISAVGFSTGGVAAGSMAAGIQAGIGSVAAGSAFAGFQSLGALGFGVLGASMVPVAMGTGIVVAAIPWVNRWRGKTEEEKPTETEEEKPTEVSAKASDKGSTSAFGFIKNWWDRKEKKK